MSDAATSRYNQKNGNGVMKPRSASTGVYDDSRTTDFFNRLKHTSAAQQHGLKGNIRGHAISSLFPTFKELLTKLPETVAFDVEMSMLNAL